MEIRIGDIIKNGHYDYKIVKFGSGTVVQYLTPVGQEFEVIEEEPITVRGFPFAPTDNSGGHLTVWSERTHILLLPTGTICTSDIGNGIKRLKLNKRGDWNRA
ncbi:MAG: hypothetical protein U1E51_30165 [Candidatus Binatia bacterium]|nr:hypothetical protein [Candidatus Binatia bacterium]